MKCLVTGGAGFIGSHLCKFLLDKGHYVICVDNFLTGKKENIDEFSSNTNFKLIEHDINLPLSLDVHQIYNLACPASPKAYMENAVETIRSSTQGVLNMLELAKNTGARFLQASTSEIYGNPLEHPQKETYWGHVNPIGPRSCYDEGKRAAECLSMDFHRMNSVDIRIIRIFNTYGPRMHPSDGRVISNFITQAIEGKPITIYGTGNQTRSFMYIDDLIDAMYSFMNQDLIIGPINVGNPEEISILELAQMIKAMTKSESELVFKPEPGDDPTMRKPEISLAKKSIGWEPRVMLDQGLNLTIRHFKELTVQNV